MFHIMKLVPKLFLSAMEHLMSVSENTCHKDPETEIYQKYFDPSISYCVLNFESPANLSHF